MFSPDFKEIELPTKELKICRICGYDHKSETSEAQHAHDYQNQENGYRCSLSHPNERKIFRGTE
jgi:hypothetical protein